MGDGSVFWGGEGGTRTPDACVGRMTSAGLRASGWLPNLRLRRLLRAANYSVIRTVTRGAYLIFQSCPTAPPTPRVPGHTHTHTHTHTHAHTPTHPHTHTHTPTHSHTGDKIGTHTEETKLAKRCVDRTRTGGTALALSWRQARHISRRLAAHTHQTSDMSISSSRRRPFTMPWFPPPLTTATACTFPFPFKR